MDDQHKPGNGFCYRSLFPPIPGSGRRCIVAAVFIGAVMAAPLGLRAQAVGYLSGQFAVDPTGAATYRVPIQVPPGVRGLHPELALLYNNRAGNGQLGMGWSLAGLSAIVRCPRTRAQDGAPGGVNFNTGDRFCLDGQRLVLIGGGRYGGAGNYRTEIESFQDIKAEGSVGSGPMNFVVRDKSGLRREYGTSGDSRPLTHNGTVRLWLLHRISDRFGNYILYRYDNVAGEFSLAEISYGNKRGVVLAGILFSYAERPDRVNRYVAGEEIPGNRRLFQISTYAAGNKVKSYVLNYAPGRSSGRSQLVSVTECDPAGNCLQPLNFGWQQGNPGFSSNADLSPLPAPMDHLQTGDFDNDGIPDYLHTSNGSWYTRLGKSPGAAVNTGLRIQNGDQPEHSMSADMNADGCTDLVTVNNSRGWYVWYSNCNGTFRASQQGYRASYSAQDKHPLLADLNGDAYPELLFKYTWAYSGSVVLAYYSNGPGGLANNTTLTNLAASHGQRLIVSNFFGNGTPDIYVTRADDCNDSGRYGSVGGSAACAQTEGVLTWNGSSLVHADIPASDMVYTKDPLFLDLNGDGLTDMLWPQCLPRCQWQVYVNRGGSWPWQYVTLAPDNGSVNEEAIKYAQAVDYNGDGLSDLIYPDTNGRWSILLSDGKTLGPRQDTELPTAGYKSTLFLDYNGNGLGDMLYLDGRWKVRLRGADIVPDLMQQVTQGAGRSAFTRHTITYLPLSDLTWRSVLYSGPSDTPDPPRTRHFLGPLYVVRSFASHAGYYPSGAPMYVSSYYRYAGAKLDQQGRGFLGFAVVEAANTNTNIVTRTRYRQDFPYTGLLSQALQYITTLSPTGVASTETQGGRICRLPNGEPDVCPSPPPQAANSILDNPPGRLVTQTDNSFAADITPVDSNGESHFPYVSSSTVNEHDLNRGTLYRKTMTRYAYDSHGNPTEITQRMYDLAGNDVYDVLTSNQYADDHIVNWCLGLPSATQITRVFNGAGLTSRMRATHNSETCVRLSETIEPGSPTLELASEYGFDAFGNRVSTTVRGANVPARTRRTEYDANGQFPVHLTNPLGHAETQSWNPAFGSRLSATDANGVTSRWQYDGFGRRSGETAPHTALQTTWSYAWCSGCRRADAAYQLTVAGTDGSRIVTEYDGLGRAVLNSRLGPVINGSAQVINTETHYDPLGRAYLVSRPYFSGHAVRCWDYRQHDNLNRLLKESQAANGGECTTGVPTLASPPAYSRITQYAYDGLRTTVTDPLGYRTTRVDNFLGQPHSVTDAGGHTTYYDYDPFGHITQVTDANGNLTRMAYDLAGRKLEMWDPDMGHWTYGYDALGQLLSQTDAKGQTLTQSYDLLGRMLKRTEAEGTTQWKYDVAYGAGIGKLAYIARDDGYSEVYAYDEYGALSDQVTAINERQYWTTTTYDAFGRVDSVLYPDISVPDVSQAPTEIPPALRLPASAPSGIFDVTWEGANDGAVYHLYRATDKGVSPAPPSGAIEVYSGLFNHHGESLSKPGSYRYWLNVCRAQNCSKLYSTAATAVNTPAAPANFRVSSENDGSDGRYQASWSTVEGAGRYVLYQSSSNAALGTTAYDGKDTTAPLTLDDGRYYYQLKACAQTGCSPYVALGSGVRVLRQPGSPRLAAPPSSANGRYTVTWSAPSDTAHIKFYELQEADSASFSSAASTTENASTTARAFNHPASDNAVYYYRIRACNQDNAGTTCSPYSNSAAVKVVPPPGLPVNLSMPSSSTSGNFRISWSAGSGGAPESYTVIGTVDVCEYDYETHQNICQRLPNAGSYTVATLYVDVSGLREGTYQYSVRACNASGCSADANAGSIKVALTPGAPSSFSTSTGSSINGNYRITWGTASNSPTSYQLYEANSLSFANQSLVYSGQALAWSATAKSPNGIYYYRARACNGAGCGPYTDTVSVQVNVLAPPGAPVNFSMPSSSTTGNFRISWSAGSGGTPESYTVSGTLEECEYDYETHQNICWRLPGGGNYTVTTSYKDISGLPAGTYYYAVRACNASGCSANANAGSIKVTLAPGAPPGLAASVSKSTNGSYKLSWGTASGSPTSYQLFEASSASFGAQSQVYSGSATSWNVSGKTPNGTYYYRARACNSAGCGPYSNSTSVQVAVPVGKPCPPKFPYCLDDLMAESNVPQNAQPRHAPAVEALGNHQLFAAQSVRPLAQLRNDYANTALKNLVQSENLPHPSRVRPAVYHAAGSGAPPLRHDARVQEHFLDQGGEPASSVELAASSKPAGTYAHMIKYSYDATGHLSQVHEVRSDGSIGTRYWAAADADAAGHVTGEVFGNGVARALGYDEATGLMLGVNSGIGATTLQSEAYSWDNAGNLRTRNDDATGLSETFDYDQLNRLALVHTVAPGVRNSVAVNYDAIGNPQARDDLGRYTYGGSPYSHTQPHAVRTLTSANGTRRNYSYDANGNLSAGGGRSIAWTSYDKPKQITANSTVAFDYAPDRSLISRVQSDGNGSIYLGRLIRSGNTARREHGIPHVHLCRR